MKPVIEVLFGFDEKTIQDGVVNYLDGCGFTVHDAVKLSKIGIEDYLNLNPSCQTVVLKEVMGKGQKYSAEELARLTDNHDVNVVVVLNDKHYGTEYMQRLYIAGITSAIFQTGRKGGASVKDIGSLIVQKRSRQDARAYYGISEEKIDIGYLTDEAYVEYFRALSNPEYGDSLLERFLQVCTYMEAPKIADFIKRLPEDTMSQLDVYQEFYDVVDLLRRMGFDLGIKRPKKVKVGLSTPAALLDAKELIESGRSGMKDQYNIVKPVQEKKPISVEESAPSRDHRDDYDDRRDRDDRDRSRKDRREESGPEPAVDDDGVDDLASLFGFDGSSDGKNGGYDEYEPDPEYEPDSSIDFDEYDEDEYVPKSENRGKYREQESDRRADRISRDEMNEERERPYHDDYSSRRDGRDDRDYRENQDFDRRGSREDRDYDRRDYRDDRESGYERDERDRRDRDDRRSGREDEYVPPEPEKKEEEPRKHRLFGKKKEKSEPKESKERKEREKRHSHEKSRDDFDEEKPAGKGGVGIKFVIISVIAWAGICAFLAFDFLVLLK